MRRRELAGWFQSAFGASCVGARRLAQFSRAAWYRPSQAHEHMALHHGPAPAPADPAERWSMDFVHDALVHGRQFRVLTVVDQWSRQSPLLRSPRACPA